MNCNQARGIVNTILDGDRHSRHGDAMQHIHNCAECREWYAQMEHAEQLLKIASEDVPEIDIASVVMLHLPARHPASRRVEGVWNAKRVLALAGMGWLMGAVILVLLGSGLLYCLHTAQGNGVLVSAYQACRNAIGTVGDVYGRVYTGLRSGASAVPAPHGLGILFLLITAMDVAVLLVMYAVWRLWSSSSRGLRIFV